MVSYCLIILLLSSVSCCVTCILWYVLNMPSKLPLIFTFLFLDLTFSGLQLFHLWNGLASTSLISEWSEVAQSCPTLCDPVDCRLPGFSVHEIFQARILEWVAIPFSRGSSQPRDWTHVSYVCCTAGRFFTFWATEPPMVLGSVLISFFYM